MDFLFISHDACNLTERRQSPELSLELEHVEMCYMKEFVFWEKPIRKIYSLE